MEVPLSFGGKQKPDLNRHVQQVAKNCQALRFTQSQHGAA